MIVSEFQSLCTCILGFIFCLCLQWESGLWTLSCTELRGYTFFICSYYCNRIKNNKAAKTATALAHTHTVSSLFGVLETAAIMGNRVHVYIWITYSTFSMWTCANVSLRTFVYRKFDIASICVIWLYVKATGKREKIVSVCVILQSKFYQREFYKENNEFPLDELDWPLLDSPTELILETLHKAFSLVFYHRELQKENYGTFLTSYAYVNSIAVECPSLAAYSYYLFLC